IKAALRRAEMSRPAETAPDEAPLLVQDVRIDFPKRSVRIRGEEVQLTFVEFEILSVLARAPGRVFTRDMLLARIWGDAAYRDPRTIDVHIRHLREKLERDPKDPEYLLTVRGVGYRFRDSDSDTEP
ncbi:MAG TPA: winged helix-turn-helix domain-containing protein, partial [Solirubrobacteraceae bacterium]|nr:winged helix-turn-helix domain-containing protein [Solirubrobacteraceae bacterium]